MIRAKNRNSYLGIRRFGLARALSKLGYCSRSRAFELIRSGRVSLNGTVQHHPETPVDPGHDRIEVDGRPVSGKAKLYLMLNKPRGLVTTAADEKGRQTVYKCLPADLGWVAPVGRLDKASEGLLLLTNDSEWGASILSPESHLDKIYHVQAAGIGGDALTAAMVKGVRVEDGTWLRAKQARMLRQGKKNSWIEIVLDEGRSRHIRRMLDGFGIEVLRLVRVAIGSVALGELPKGVFRHLSEAEKGALDASVRVTSTIR